MQGAAHSQDAAKVSRSDHAEWSSAAIPHSASLDDRRLCDGGWQCRESEHADHLDAKEDPLREVLREGVAAADAGVRQTVERVVLWRELEVGASSPGRGVGAVLNFNNF